MPKSSKTLCTCNDKSNSNNIKTVICYRCKLSLQEKKTRYERIKECLIHHDRIARYGESFLLCNKCHKDGFSIECVYSENKQTFAIKTSQNVNAKHFYNKFYDNLDLYLYTEKKWNSFSKNNVCVIAAQNGWCDLLLWGRLNGGSWNSKICSIAAKYNHLDILKLAKMNDCHWDVKVTIYT